MVKTTNHPVDLHVGQKLRQRRLLLGMTQEQLAEAVGVSFQMIQKYEKGARVSVSRLTHIAKALSVSNAYFFPSEAETPTRKLSEDQTQIDDDILSQKETITLLKAYYALPENQRKHILEMIKSLDEKSDDK